MAKGKRSKKKENDLKVDIQITAILILSILLGTLIYMKSGYIGMRLNVILGGLVSWTKYLIPVGIFVIGIYLMFNKKEGLKGKIFQFTILVLCICTFLSANQFSKGEFAEYNDDINLIAERGYELGIRGIGGGAVGTLIAMPIFNLIGQAGCYIFVIGVGLMTCIFLFGIRPIEFIKTRLEESKKARRYEEKEEIEEVIPRRTRAKLNKKLEMEEPDLLSEQIQINIKEPEDNKKDNKASFIEANLFKNSNKKKKEEPMESVAMNEEEELFKQAAEVKEDKTKQILTLDHTITVEDEEYEFPPVNLLQEGETKKTTGKKALTDTAAKLQKTLYSFGVSAKVENVSVGPAITRYELKPAEGVRVSKIANLADDIALNLAAETIRIEAPIPGKQAVGIEIPNKEKEAVHLREIIDSKEFQNSDSKTTFALGKDVAGEVVVTDIAKMPHVLIAGSTGSGKSVCINTLIASIIYKAKPSEVKLVMIDPKVVELSIYNGIPHLLIPVVTDAKKAAGALMWAVQEMVNRYGLFAQKGVRDIKGYNKAIESDGEKLPHIIIIIDELADLMMVSPKDVEDSICRLAQMARAAGMHLVVATQRPSVDVITGIIKANIPSRISFAVSSGIDSRTILDMYGAEKLLGKGDMLFSPVGSQKPQRIQGAFISDAEVEKIVDFLKAGREVTYNSDIIEKIEKNNSTDKELAEDPDDDTDEFLMDAIDVVVETGQASTSFIQRRFKVGYARAGRIMDQMEARGIISGYEGSKPRQVLITKEQLEELKMAKPPATGATEE